MKVSKLLILLLVITSLVVSNFLFQYFRDVPNYLVAMDRSFFQSVAWAITMYVTVYISKDRK